jgi:outer membrane protein assembly factor BamB
LGFWLPRTAPAQDWPQWRGPHRDGVWHETGTIQAFPADGLKIAWRAPLGAGFSSPIVWQGRVYVTDSQLARPQAHERVQCFDTKTGQIVWTHSNQVLYADWAFDPKNSFGPRPTPIIDQGKLFTLGARGHLICFEAEHGKILWEKDFPNKDKDSAFTPSPLIEGDLLIFVLDGLPPGPCVVALDKKSGQEIWKAVDETPTFSSPIIVTAAGQRQLIIWINGALCGLNPATGAQLWREHHNDGSVYAIPTPVVHDDLLFVNGVMLKLDSQRVGASVLWPQTAAPSRRMMSDTSTGVFIGEHLFAANVSGELVCIEPKTGQIVWATNRVTTEQSGTSIHVTPHDESALLFNDNGELIHAQLSVAGYKEMGRSPLLRPTTPFGPRPRAWVPPAYGDGRVFARSDAEIVCAILLTKPEP